MRGERPRVKWWMACVPGSSPHARGTLNEGIPLNGYPRFIPACAGNAFLRGNSQGRRPVHPRMRGERRCMPMAHARCVGSSPHARGTLSAYAQYRVDWRFIPACAGNAESRGFIHPIATVHPRMRGERPSAVMSRFFCSGSSPHARGTLQAGRQRQNFQRFIPACAGNAIHDARAFECSAVHPRMRGERGRSVMG